MLLISNTGAVGVRNGLNGYPYPRRGLAGIFDDWSTDDVSKATTAVNSELLYLMNLDRVKNGLAPISASNAAPTVNVGLSPEIKTALMVGAGVLLLVMLAKKKR